MDAVLPIGDRTQVERVVVEPAEATRFAMCLGDDASMRLGVASPMYLSSLARGAFAELILSIVGLAAPNPTPAFVHLVRDLEISRPTLPGESFDAMITVASYRRQLGGGLMTFVTTYVDDDGAERVLVRDVAQIIGQLALEEFGDDLPEIDLGRVKGLEPTGVIEVPDDINERWAEAVGDFQAIHLEDEAAQALGFTKAIVHGSYTIAAGVHHLVRGMLDDDPRRLRRIACRLAKPVFQGDVLRVEAMPSTDSRIPFRISARGRSVVRGGFIEVELPSEGITS